MKSIKRIPGLQQLLWVICMAMMSLPLTAASFSEIDLQEDWGIEPVLIRVTAEGYMIEFRYKILDTEKALVLSSRKVFPRLQASKSNARLGVPFGPTVGFLKSNRGFLKLGKNYITMFSNEGQHLLPGDKVRLEVGTEISPELLLE